MAKTAVFEKVMPINTKRFNYCMVIEITNRGCPVKGGAP